MPSFPIPYGGSALSGGDLPVKDGSDVVAQFADTHRRVDVAPIRDAFVEAYAETHIVYQDEAAEALAQCDPLRATGDYLVAHAVERQVPVLPGDSEDSLRARLFTSPKIVTPQAIIDVVNAILADVTDEECNLIELELDGGFIHDGVTDEWGYYIAEQPHYPDRLYEEDAAYNDGFFLENNSPGSSLVSSGALRNFHLLIPKIEDPNLTFCIDAVDDHDEDGIMPISDGSNASNAELDGSVVTFIFESGMTDDEVYAAIGNAVDSIKGQGMSWSAEVAL